MDIRSTIVLAKVNAIQEKDFVYRYKINGYPTIFFFKRTEPIEYEGERNAHDILEWLKRKTASTVQTIDAMESFESITRFNDVVVIGLTEVMIFIEI